MSTGNIKLFEEARRLYKPLDYIEFLLIGESPPESGGKRFFYFEDVSEHDNLYKETMRVLYPEHSKELLMLRGDKSIYLSCFREDRFYLIDAADDPINKLQKTERKRILKSRTGQLIEKVKGLDNPVNHNMKIILISSLVYQCCYEPLKNRGLNVINRGMIPFPLGTGIKGFHTKLKELLIEHGWKPQNSYNIF